MASTGRQLKIKGVIIALLTLGLINTGCEERIDNPTMNPSEGKMVEVSLNIGLADETDGYTLAASPSTKSMQEGAFEYNLQPSLLTKSTGVNPDKLYNLEIQQYNRSGARIGGVSSVVTQDIGSALTVKLTANTDCQLVIVAWGKGNLTTLGNTSLSDAQTKSVTASVIENLDPNIQADMNKMPYVLHLEHVCIKGNAIKSIEGKDVRLLLRRLATRLTLTWNYNYAGYALKQILLQSIPLDYKVVAAPDKTDKTYPSLLDQYRTIQLDDTQIGKGSYSCWIPANVRGTNPSATSQAYRVKSNAPTGCSYVDFIASKTGDVKKKLSYRVYLGGSEPSDFNLYGNTDYNYTIRIAHTDLPINDRRVTIIDPIPASQNNDNLVPTANCFMVAPGGAFCFNPYKYYINGSPSENTLLQGWCVSNKIKSVKVLWQTKENGDVGDSVLGVVNSSDDHTNIVDLTDGGDFDKARIYCRVAPNTTGGSGLIAAYDGDNGTGNILWSWHIWITDYAPSATANETILEPANKRILKFTIGSANQRPMMDRNLGAISGYIDQAPDKEIDRAKANGFHYQWGRKDLYPSSFTNDKSQRTITITSTTEPTHGIMNLFQADGVTYQPYDVKDAQASYQEAYQNPLSLYLKKDCRRWIAPMPDGFRTVWLNKTVHDPCPAGWRIPVSSEYTPLRNQKANTGNVVDDGGILLYFDKEKKHSTYIRLTGYWYSNNIFKFISTKALIWSGDDTTNGSDPTGGGDGFYLFIDYDGSAVNGEIINTGHEIAALSLRCIQDRK